jgi:hypothetical protein
MYTLNEIEAMLRAEENDLRQRIVRSLGSSTIALFALYGQANERLELAGSGTLVCVGDSHYILTAAHVWEEILKHAPRLGITMTDEIGHKTPIDIATLVPTILKPQNSSWNEWGPDVAVLRIPSEYVGAIEAFHVFEHLEAPLRPLNAESLEAWIVIGNPKELGTFTDNRATVQISGRFVSPQSHERAEYDYFDFEMNADALGVKSFGGLSGGGLWRVLVYNSPETGKIDWAQRLKGVVFWEFPAKDGSCSIRCHGPKSLDLLMRAL